MASYGRFWPCNAFHQWKVIPRDGAFVFRNFATRQLLSQSMTSSDVIPTSATSLDNPACQWKLVDAISFSPCRVLYDSTLSIMPPELGVPVSETASTRLQGSPAVPPPQLVLKTESASPILHHQFFAGVKHDHELIREMLKSGYTSLMIAPQLVRGWKNGRVHDVTVREGETALRLWKLKGRGNFDLCVPT